jgi:hypothetical protein
MAEISIALKDIYKHKHSISIIYKRFDVFHNQSSPSLAFFRFDDTHAIL